MLGFISLSFGQSGSQTNAAPVWIPQAAETNVVGTWKAHPVSFTVISRMIPNTLPRPQCPTNFILVLRKNGGFVATNVPANMFFDWPATPTCAGTWSVEPVFAKEIAESYSYLTLSFTKPHYGVLQVRIYRYSKDASSAFKPAIAFGPFKDESQSYEYDFSIVKGD